MQQNMQSMPGPYAHGGHVALRRKMFKLGGDVNTHGVGITSGLAYNTGGSVKPKRGLVDEPGGYAGKLKIGEKLIWDPLKKVYKWVKGKGSGAPGKPVTTTGTGVAGPWATTRTGPRAFTRWDRLGQVGRGTTAATGILGTPGAVSALIGDRLGDYASTEEDWKGSGAERALKGLRHAMEFGLDWSAPGFAFEIGDYLTRDPSVTPGYGGLSDFLAGRGRGELDPATGSRSAEEGITPQPVDFGAEQAALRKQQMEEAMQMYQDLMDTGDDSQKWRDLGNALIAGGSSLMEGEGWGPSAEAFNEPLAMANARKLERDDAVRQMAASQAIAEVSSQDLIMQAAMAEQLGAGDYSMAEATKKFSFAQQSGVNTLLPTNEKGEVDTEKLALLAGQVVADVTNATGEGGVFVAIATDGTYISTNDIEEAKRYAAS